MIERDYYIIAALLVLSAILWFMNFKTNKNGK